MVPRFILALLICMFFPVLLMNYNIQVFRIKNYLCEESCNVIVFH
jgi:hypothetical protein